MTDFVPGGIANAKGDLFGTSPFRIIKAGMVVLPVDRAAAACTVGWRPVSDHNLEGHDPDYACLQRTAEDREAVG